MTQQQEQVYGPYVGTISRTEEQTPQGKPPYWRIELQSQDGSTRWFSAFGNVPKIMLSQPEAAWACTYTIWVGTNGNQRYTIKDAQTSTASVPVATPVPAQNTVQHMPVDQTLPPQAQPAPQPETAAVTPEVVSFEWVPTVDHRSRSIIRQCAFKGAVDIYLANHTQDEIKQAISDGTMPTAVHALTDTLEPIIYGVQPAPASLESEFIQTEI